MTQNIERSSHLLSELGLTLKQVDDELHAAAAIKPEMYVPGTDCLRTSVLAAWADTVTGILCAGEMAPRVPVTIDLTIELYRPPLHCREITGAARILKTGRSAAVAEADFEADGEPVAVATASFTPTPDPAPSLPSMQTLIAMHAESRSSLSMPLAERAGCTRLGPGVASMPRSPDGMNASNTINGGLIALLVEESALSLDESRIVTSLALRYLRPARVGPVVAAAEPRGDLARIEVRDHGSDHRLVVLATARTALP